MPLAAPSRPTFLLVPASSDSLLHGEQEEAVSCCTGSLTHMVSATVSLTRSTYPLARPCTVHVLTYRAGRAVPFCDMAGVRCRAHKQAQRVWPHTLVHTRVLCSSSSRPPSKARTPLWTRQHAVRCFKQTRLLMLFDVNAWTF